MHSSARCQMPVGDPGRVIPSWVGRGVLEEWCILCIEAEASSLPATCRVRVLRFGFKSEDF